MYWLISFIPMSRILVQSGQRPLMPPAGAVVNSTRAITCPIHDV